MILDIETNLRMEKKRFLTPKHAMYQLSEEECLKYGAAVFSLMYKCSADVLSRDFEMQRLLEKGLLLSKEKIVAIYGSNLDARKYIVWLNGVLDKRWKKCVFLMDYYNILISQRQQEEFTEEHLVEGERQLKKIATYFQVPENVLLEIIQFIKYCRDEEKLKALSEYEYIIKFAGELPEMVLKYYGITNTSDLLCTQKMLEKKKEVTITDRCVIKEDLVLKQGMKLSFLYSEVRIYGNISIEGGELYLEHCRMIRKNDSHRACINIKTGGMFNMRFSEGDGRNFGMFLRSAGGSVTIEDSFIHNTTRGAAIRFWGQTLAMTNVRFENCYSYENGGAVMARGGKGSITQCSFLNCEAKQGGAIYTTSEYEIYDCNFRKCSAEEFGACIFYHGIIAGKVRDLRYTNCCPEGAEIVQYFYQWGSCEIDDEVHLHYGTIIDSPITIRSTGKVFVDGATLYMNYPIQCMGSLFLNHATVICYNYEGGKDLIQLQNAKKVVVSHCFFDGKLKSGMIHAGMSRIQVSDSVFCNTKDGRAIYNAYMSDIRNSLFNFCQDGAIHCQGGEISGCTFVNCRSKSGAGVLILGNHGTIQNCHFRRCVSKLSGGAIDRTRGQRVIKCTYENCLPDNCN